MAIPSELLALQVGPVVIPWYFWPLLIVVIGLVAFAIYRRRSQM